MRRKFTAKIMSKKIKRNKPAVECYAPLLVLPTSTSPDTVAEARAAGYLVISCDDPSKVVLRFREMVLAGDDLLMAALHGLSNATLHSERGMMVKELYRRLLKNETNP